MSIFGSTKASRGLEEDIRLLRNEVKDLRSDHRRLCLEWEELYDKVRRQMGRMSKRIAVDNKINDGPTLPEESSSSSVSDDPISKSILLRRGGQGITK